jgi:hypothetical protein
VEHDLALPIDHLWWGPILFSLVVALLLLGLRLGYPRFRPRPATGWSTAEEPAWAATIACNATGRITPPGASPFEIDDLPAVLRREPTGDTSLGIEIDGRPREFLIPQNLGGLGATEVGDLLTVRAPRPALKVGWFGSNVLLVFGDRASRDAARSMFRAVD